MNYAGIRLRVTRIWSRLEKARVPLLVLGALAAIAIVLWQVPEWQVPEGVTDPKGRAELANEFRKTIAQIVGGLVIIVGVYATWRRVASAERTVEFAQEQQITERFTRAVDQLGDVDNEAIILGGIYTLERIARDSRRDHWQVMGVVIGYTLSIPSARQTRV